jgi:hypothetical protein
MIALNMAIRLHADPLMVMQNLYIVHGYPSWSAKFLIALFNTCGRFTAPRYAMGINKDTCFAYCTEIATGERIDGPMVTLAMAKAEGWMDRKNSKWRTMPEVMLRNRAATFLIRSTAPELSMGLMTDEEARDVIDIEAAPVVTPSALQSVRDILAKTAAAPPSTTPAPAEEEEEDEPLAEPDPPPTVEPTTPAPVTPEPVEEGVDVMYEPKRLPLKDGELTPQDATRRAKPARPKTAPASPAFSVEAFASRVAAIGDLDMLTLLHDEIAAMSPCADRDDCMALLDARTRALLSNDLSSTDPRNNP